MPPVNRSRKAGSRAMRTPMVTELMTRAPCLSTICSFPAWSCLSTTGSWSESPTHLTSGTTAIRTGTASRTKKSKSSRGGSAEETWNTNQVVSFGTWTTGFTLLTKIRATVSQTGNSKPESSLGAAGNGDLRRMTTDESIIPRAAERTRRSSFNSHRSTVCSTLSGQTEANFRTVFPIAPVPDAQGGRRRVGPNGGLNAFTGCAGQGIFRGDRLPKELYGDLFIPEPVGRLVRRAKVDRKDGMTVLSNATPGSEFMRSKDINFRPLGAETAPDGTMFFIDMHRGIIQQGNWTRKGSYLRGIIDKWEIDKNAGKGRIYRLVHKDHKPGPQPNMLGQSTKELVGHLSHPNGWWRDTAQKLIILRKDGKSVVPELEKLARSGKSALGRVHALWTLEGMDAVDPKLIVEKLSDSDHRVRLAAVRVSEPFLSNGDNALESAFKTLEKEPHADAALQAINSIAYSGATESEVLAGIQDTLIEKHSDKPILKSIAGNRAKLAQERERLAKQRKMDAHFAKQMESGAVIYKQLCFACHGNDGKGTPMVGQPGVTLAPPLPKSPRVLGSGGSLVRTVLHGLQGPLDGKTYPGQMLPLGANDDEWVAAISTYVRNSFGNKGGPITKEFVAGIRKESGDRLLPWTEAELEELEPPLMADRKKWKLTASHGSEKLGGCVDGNGKSRYDTGTSQVPGMWVQVEFPSVSKVNRIQLDSKSSARDYPRGYQVESSVDGKKWSEPLAIGVGKHPMTDISFSTTEAKFLKITQTGRVNGLYWSIHEMQIFGKPVPR